VCGHLAVISHVVHHRWDGRLFAYTPYARELDLWASMVDRLTVIAPVRDGRPPPDTTALAADNVDVAPQIEAGGDDRRAKLAQLLHLPAMVRDVDRALRGADAVQVRCPGNLGLIGALVAPLRSGRVMAKYAGQWHGYHGEPAAWRLQRVLLRSRWFRGPVLAYGPAGGDRSHVIPAFSTAVDAAVLARASEVAARRGVAPAAALRVLFVGRLTAAKNVDAVIEAVHRVATAGAPVSLRIVGDGPERDRLGILAERLGSGSVELTGALDQVQVLDEYADADVLVLASESEGWPKAIVEAMAFGVVCIGNDRGLVPAILGDGRGFTVGPGDEAAIAEVLASLVSDRDALARRSRASARWASRFSLEAFEDELRRILSIAWREPSRWWRPPMVRGTVELLAPQAAGPGGPPRVMQVIDSLAAGGAEQVAVHLANELARSGHESSLVATRSSGPLARSVDASVWQQTLGRTGRFSPAAVVALRRAVAERGIDVIHAHSTSIFLVSASFAVGRRPAIVWHDHTSAAGRRNPWPLRAVGRWIDVGVAVSHEIEMADRRRLWLDGRLERVPNFSVLDGTARPVAGLPGAPGARIVCVANLRPAKDQVVLVEAMAVVARARPDAHLLLVGADTSDYAGQVRRRVAHHGLGGRVSLLGLRTDVSGVLAACDIGVLASTAEGTPLAVLEYGLAGLPVVATSVGELSEVLGPRLGDPNDGAAGVLVAPGDGAGLARELVRLLDDPVERARLGEALRRRVEAEHSSGAVLASWDRVYRAALRRRAARDSR
jgi:glycosyltransferase involved in cell wall biosynthesis